MSVEPQTAPTTAQPQIAATTAAQADDAAPPVPPPAHDTRRIDRFLELMVERGASDLHMSVGRPPMFRASGSMEPIRFRTLEASDFESMIRPMTPAEQWADFEKTGDVDFAYQLRDSGRFRVNLFRQRRGPGAVFRIIPTKILSVEELALPPQLSRLAKLEDGLALVTGPTGSGKSTTLAALIDLINRTRKLHILTIEDPIEFVHPNKRSLIHQRESGAHTPSFAAALKAAVREDPDIILVGEMRDRETISLALEAAEKGVLVFGTLHTNNAAKTVDRIVNVFPSGEQESVRQVLGDTVRAIVAQQLVPKAEGGRVAALEILFGSHQAGAMIRENKTAQLNSYIQTNRNQGMVTMDQSLADLFEKGLITAEAALDKAIDKVYIRKATGLAADG